MAVASAGPCARLHLAPDRQPHQHPTTLVKTFLYESVDVISNAEILKSL